MEYKIKAHPTTYAGVNFRSRLEARWAAFFNCMKWKWTYEPIDLVGWSPDFRLWLPMKRDIFPVLVEIKPYTHVEQFNDHIASKLDEDIGLFGEDPSVTRVWINAIGEFELDRFFRTSTAWIAAGNLTQWKKEKKKKKLTKEQQWDLMFKGKKQIISGVVKRATDPKKQKTWDELLIKGF